MLSFVSDLFTGIRILDNKRKNIIKILLLLYILQYLAFYSAYDIQNIIAINADDAYYYYEIAKNILDTGQITYDGIQSTNGFHPVYLAFLTGVFNFVEGDLLRLRIVGVITTIMMTITLYVGISYIQKRYRSITLYLSLIPAFYLTHHFIRINMETTILLPLLFITIYVFSEWEILTLNTENYKLFIFGLLLGMIHITRLDAVIFTMLTVIMILYGNYSSIASIRKLREFLIIASPPAITGLGYLSFNLYFFHRFTPISGQIKAMGNEIINNALVSQLTPRTGMKLFDFVTLVLLLVSLFYVYFELSNRVNNKLGLLVSTFTIIHLVYYLIASSSGWLTWYHYPPLLVSIFVLPDIIKEIIDSIQHTHSRFGVNQQQVIKSITVLCVLLLIIFVGIYTPISLLSENVDQNYEMAQYTNEHYDDDVRFAITDGLASFGYFSKHKTVQLEGIVSNNSAIEPLHSGDLEPYMNRYRIDYLIMGQYPPDEYNKTERNISHLGSIDHITLTVEKKCQVTSRGEAPRPIWDWECLQNSSMPVSATQATSDR